MPTVTEMSQVSFWNAGPLTATATLAESCPTPNIRLGLKETPGRFKWYQDCASKTNRFANCLPSGSLYDGAYSVLSSKQVTGVLAYHSPGLYCPSGWTTAGVAEKSGDGALSTSGLFTRPTDFDVLRLFRPNPWENMLMGAIDPGETAILCCPSSMTATLGACISTLPSYTITEGCLPLADLRYFTRTTVTISIFGQTAQADIFSLTATTAPPPGTTEFQTFTSGSQARDNPSDLVGVSVLPIVTLIHKASDVAGAETNTPAASDKPGRGSSTGVGKGTAVFAFVWSAAMVAAGAWLFSG